VAARAADLIDRWRAGGASRLDRNLDGRIDAPGAAVMDAAWNGMASAVMRPVLGPLTSSHFIPGLLPYTMRWTNRSTFQQVIELTGRAPS
jgi:hypothetical protein